MASRRRLSQLRPCRPLGICFPRYRTGVPGLTLNFERAIPVPFEITAAFRLDFVAFVTVIVFFTSPLETKYFPEVSFAMFFGVGSRAVDRPGNDQRRLRFQISQTLFDVLNSRDFDFLDDQSWFPVKIMV